MPRFPNLMIVSLQEKVVVQQQFEDWAQFFYLNFLGLLWDLVRVSFFVLREVKQKLFEDLGLWEHFFLLNFLGLLKDFVFARVLVPLF